MSANADRDVLVHLGFPKALSSWLQKHWFVAECGYQTLLDPVQVQLKLIDPAPFAFDPQPAVAQMSASASDELLGVITSESLSGNMYSGGYDARTCIDRVLEIAPSARLLLIVREQRTLIRSLYKSLVTWGMPHSIERLLDPDEPRLVPQFNLDYLRFDDRVAYYQSLVGADRVLVLPYELFVAEPLKFLQSIHKFSGAGKAPDWDSLPVQQRVNPGQSLLNLELQRLANYWLHSGAYNYSGLLRPSGAAWQRRIRRSKRNPFPAFTNSWFEAGFQSKVERATAGVYADSNQRLQQLAGLELKSYGYQL